MECPHNDINEIREYMKYLGFGVVKKHFSIMLLWLISKNKTHGYKIMDDVNKKCGFIVKLTPSKIYPMLKKLENDGLVVSKKIRKGKRIKKEYTISKRGKSVLKGLKKLMTTGPAGEFYKDMVK